MKLFKCNHHWATRERSNVLQQDSMGYPLRLYICKCTKCNKTKYFWLDVNEENLDELKTGKSFLITWTTCYKKEEVHDHKRINNNFIKRIIEWVYSFMKR